MVDYITTPMVLDYIKKLEAEVEALEAQLSDIRKAEYRPLETSLGGSEGQSLIIASD